jgi:uncharacterized protein YbbK (DUF523 family)
LVGVTSTGRPRVGISRCLLGDDVRYDGGHRRDPALLDALREAVEWVPVCPEVEVGMGVPREPIRLVRGGCSVRLLGVESGRDWTDQMRTWAGQRIAELQSLDLAGFVVKARSPSCGVRDVPIHAAAGDAGTGPGMFAAMLIESAPGLPVEDEERLRDPGARARFIERVRQHAARGK